MRYVFYIVGLFFYCGVTMAQQDSLLWHRTEQKAQDREKAQQLEKISSNNKWTLYLYRLLFRSSQPPTLVSSKISPQEGSRKFYQGKIIRKIRIRVADPFGYDEKDTLVEPTHWAMRWGNKFHTKTRAKRILKILQFSEGEPLDTLKLENSEVMLRQQQYIRRAKVVPIALNSTKDSVDVWVSVLDAWSIGGSLSGSDKEAQLSIADYNFLGLGHYMVNSVKRQNESPARWGYTYGYDIRNIGRSFINTGIFRNVEPTGEELTSLYIRRPFYSSIRRWSLGLLYMNRSYFENIVSIEENHLERSLIKQQFLDIWGSYLYPLKKMNWDMILSLRYQRTDFPLDLEQRFDFDIYYTDENLTLFTLALRRVGYKHDYYIFRNGDKEDIAQGKEFSVTLGWQDNLGRQNPYLGLSYLWSSYGDRGYFSFLGQWGSYFTQHHFMQMVLRLRSIYISPVFRWGRWNFRQFARMNWVLGWDRKSFFKDRVTLNSDYGISGFYSPYVFGQHKYVFHLQTRAYTPYQILGFRLNPFVSIDMGLLSKKNQAFNISEMYSRFGVGVILKNDYFIFSDVHLALYFFPKIPGSGSHIFKFTYNQRDDFILEDYRYTRPSIVDYR